jgi:hypothetical protein
MIAAPAPGLYRDVPEQQYHGDLSSLSSTGAKTLATRSPAEFDWERRNGRPPKKEFDFGSAAHRYLLGKGAEIEVVHYDSWRTDGAKKQRAKAYKAGRVPLLVDVDVAARELAAKTRRHPLVAELLADGEAEVSGWWVDEETGAPCRVRPDWMTRRGEHVLIADAKFVDDSAPAAFEKSLYRWGYHQQAPWYVDGIAALLEVDPQKISFLFVAVSKTGPYLVNLYELDADAMRIGARRNREARETFVRCTESGIWPDYGLGPHVISLPAWATYREDHS